MTHSLPACPTTASFARRRHWRDGLCRAVAVYLALALTRLPTADSTVCVLGPVCAEQHRNTFGRQAIPMVWDFAESNPLSDASGNYGGRYRFRLLQHLNSSSLMGQALETGRCAIAESSAAKVVSTDPPYYDNIGYADLSDFFYVWLRRSLKPVFPDLFATLAVPKAEELVATPYRHGSKEKAEAFFLDGMTQAMHRLAEQAHPAFPVTSITPSSSRRARATTAPPAPVGRPSSTRSFGPDLPSAALGRCGLNSNGA